jgi:hypothetical protein
LDSTAIEQGKIRTYVNRGRGGTFYIAIEDLTSDKKQIWDILSPKGYRMFTGRYTKQVTPSNIQNISNDLQELQQMGIEVERSGLDKIQKEFEQLAQQTATPSKEPSETEIQDFVTKLKTEMTKTDMSEQAKMMGDLVLSQLEQLAQSVDEASKDKFVIEFLNFSAKFWNYSWLNQMLIFFQTGGHASYVKGEKQWEKVGRSINPDAKPIWIVAPRFASNKVTDKALQYVYRFVHNYNQQNPPNEHDLTNALGIRKFLGMAKRSFFPSVYNYLLSLYQRGNYKTTDEIETYLEGKSQSGSGDASRGGGVTQFIDVKVYDISDTSESPGWEEKTGNPPLREPPQDLWQSKYNTPTAATTAILRAALKFAAEKKIKVDLEADTGHAGGWSRGTEIAVNKQSAGERQLSTTIHEIAHSLIHFGDDRAQTSSQEKEIDAESTAYIALSYFLSKLGYKGDYAPRYLALHGADSKKNKS